MHVLEELASARMRDPAFSRSVAIAKSPCRAADLASFSASKFGHEIIGNMAVG